MTATVLVMVSVVLGGVSELELAESIPPSTSSEAVAPSTTVADARPPAITTPTTEAEIDVVSVAAAVLSSPSSVAMASSTEPETLLAMAVSRVTAPDLGIVEAAPEGPVANVGVMGEDGRVIRVHVAVEDGLGIDETEARREVARILGDDRGWTASGAVRFELVDETAVADARLLIASPATVDRRCAPLQTVGRLSCRNGSGLNINADRWLGATSFWDRDIAEYRAYVVNHEMGHLLGHGHVWCAAEGEPAPVMQQQTKGLAGCTGNGWPFLDG